MNDFFRDTYLKADLAFIVLFILFAPMFYVCDCKNIQNFNFDIILSTISIFLIAWHQSKRSSFQTHTWGDRCWSVGRQ